MVIGLTGGIASGKSTAARYMKDLGAKVIDADLLGHRAYEPDTQAFREVVATFGDDVVGDDGQIDRKALGGKVFGNPNGLKQLTDIVWPEIRRMAESEIATIHSESPGTVIVLEAAVLFEAEWQDAVDEVWTVVVERDVAVRRAMARDGSDEAAIQKRIDAQLSNEERRSRSHVVINNSGSETELLSRLDEQWSRLNS